MFEYFANWFVFQTPVVISIFIGQMHTHSGYDFKSIKQKT